MTRSAGPSPADVLPSLEGPRHAAPCSQPAEPSEHNGSGTSQQRRIVRWIGELLMLALVVLFFVPMSGNAEDGNATFRLLILGIAAVAIMAALERPSLTLALLWRLWPLLLLLGWLLVTSRWASHPDISIRRSFAYILMFVIAVSLAVSFDRPNDIHRPFMQGLSTVLIVNWVSAHTIAPIDPSMGVNGIYAQKNGAGALALYAIVVASSAVLLYSRWYLKLFSACVVLLAWSFLISTHAKTSITTAALLTLAMPVIGRSLAQPASHKAVAGTLLAFLLGGALFTQYALGISWHQVGEAIFSDLTFTNRTFIWDALYPEITRHPWTGAGFGSFWATGDLVNPISNAPADAFFMSPDVINEAHNGFIDITLQAGYIGLILTGLVILRSIWAMVSVIGAPSAGRENRLACTMVLCVLIAQVASNCTESQIFSPSNPIGYMFVVMAVQAERWRFGDDERRRHQDTRLHQAPSPWRAGAERSGFARAAQGGDSRLV